MTERRLAPERCLVLERRFVLERRPALMRNRHPALPRAGSRKSTNVVPANAGIHFVGLVKRFYVILFQLNSIKRESNNNYKLNTSI
jgi:hypothetical protein